MTNSKPHKERLDALLVSRGLELTRTRAQARILAGDVLVGEHRVDKPGTQVSVDAVLRIKENSIPYVSRGGFKLEAAIQKWPAQIAGAICLDVGASTGGFTDVLLKNGAKHVFAVDVGYGQLAYQLRQDARVTSMERTHMLKVPRGTFNPTPTIGTIDVSFISLLKVLPAVLGHLAPAAVIYALIKPQFEVGPEQVGKGGIVRDENARAMALQKVLDCAQAQGLHLLGYAESPITGTDGNVEYIAGWKVP